MLVPISYLSNIPFHCCSWYTTCVWLFWVGKTGHKSKWLLLHWSFWAETKFRTVTGVLWQWWVDSYSEKRTWSKLDLCKLIFIYATARSLIFWVGWPFQCLWSKFPMIKRAVQILGSAVHFYIIAGLDGMSVIKKRR